ncbi:His-Xaa-Ser system protein HxsD [Methylophilaceae bacterium]|nr:His-Xaa-Ser system protein HxsD [Methylophilaceae bacterium]
MTSRLTFEKAVCSIESFQKAAYRLSNFITIDIDTSSDQHNAITINQNKSTSDEQFIVSVENFKKYVNDESLREKIKSDTEPIRNLILGIAFSKTKLQSDE